MTLVTVPSGISPGAWAGCMSLKLEGAGELIRELENLPGKIVRRVMRNALRKAGGFFADAAQSRVPSETGLLRQSIGLSKPKWYASSGTMFVAAGPRRGYRRAVSRTARGLRFLGPRASEAAEKLGASIRNPVHYAHLVEGGRKSFIGHFGRATFVNPAVPARPFMARAFAATKAAMEITLRSELAAGIEREGGGRMTSSKAAYVSN